MPLTKALRRMVLKNKTFISPTASSNEIGNKIIDAAIETLNSVFMQDLRSSRLYRDVVYRVQKQCQTRAELKMEIQFWDPLVRKLVHKKAVILTSQGWQSHLLSNK